MTSRGVSVGSCTPHNLQGEVVIGPPEHQCHKTTLISHAEEPKGEAWCIREEGHEGPHVYAFMLHSEKAAQSSVPGSSQDA